MGNFFFKKLRKCLYAASSDTEKTVCKKKDGVMNIITEKKC